MSALLGAVVGKKALGKVIEDAAVDAVKAPRTKPHKTKKSAKPKSKGNTGWVIPLVIGLILLALLVGRRFH